MKININYWPIWQSLVLWLISEHLVLARNTFSTLGMYVRTYMCIVFIIHVRSRNRRTQIQSKFAGSLLTLKSVEHGRRVTRRSESCPRHWLAEWWLVAAKITARTAQRTKSKVRVGQYFLLKFLDNDPTFRFIDAKHVWLY